MAKNFWSRIYRKCVVCETEVGENRSKCCTERSIISIRKPTRFVAWRKENYYDLNGNRLSEADISILKKEEKIELEQIQLKLEKERIESAKKRIILEQKRINTTLILILNSQLRSSDKLIVEEWKSKGYLEKRGEVYVPSALGVSSLEFLQQAIEIREYINFCEWNKELDRQWESKKIPPIQNRDSAMLSGG